VEPETLQPNSATRGFTGAAGLSAFVWQTLVIYVYLCAPRVALVLRVPSSELQLNHGFFDQTLAYLGVLLGLYYLISLIGSARVRRTLVRILIMWLHFDFLVRCGEAALMYQFDMGYSSLLVFHRHCSWSVRQIGCFVAPWYRIRGRRAPPSLRCWPS
jgi:hypothetical protein